MTSRRSESDPQLPTQNALVADAILSIVQSASKGAASADAINTLLHALLINTTATAERSGGGGARNDSVTERPPNATRQALEQLTGSCCVSVVDSVADLQALTDSHPAAITRGYHNPLDGGGAIYWKGSGTSPGGNDMSIIDRTDGGWYELQIFGEYLPSKQCGIKGDSSGGETDLITAAAQLCWTSLKKGLLIQGRPKLDKILVIEHPLRIKFEGSTGTNGLGAAEYPASFFYGNNTISLPDPHDDLEALVCILHPGVCLEGGGVVGDWADEARATSWQGDAVFIGAHGVTWTGGTFKSVGRDGIRVGDYSAGPGTNANAVYLDKCVVSNVGRHGINFSDDHGAADANAFLLTGFEAHHCGGNGGGYGIHVDAAGLGGTILAPNCEFNATGGIYISSDPSGSVVVVGGDFEGNGSGVTDNIVDASDGERLLLVGTHNLANTLNQAPTLHAKALKNAATEVWVENTLAHASASAQVRLKTTQGWSGMQLFSAQNQGWCLLGNFDHAGPLGVMLNGIIRWGFNANGSLGIGGFSGVGTSGEVLTSQGSGAATAWKPVGPTTTKGDISTRDGSGPARLGVGADTFQLVANAATATGLQWIANPSVKKSGDSMTGDLTISKSDATLLVEATAGSATIHAKAGGANNANLVAEHTGGAVAGMRAASAYAEVGTVTAHELRLISNGVLHVTVDAAGGITLAVTAGQPLTITGLPSSNPGGSGRVWKNGSVLNIT